MNVSAMRRAMKSAGCTDQQILAAIEADDEDRRSRAREGNRKRQAALRSRSRNGSNAVTPRDMPLHPVTGRDMPLPDPEPRACVLYGEDSLIKELPTVVRKIEPDQTSDPVETARPEPTIVSDIRKAKKAAESRILDFVGEGWNALCAEFPRIVSISVIQDGSGRERAILSRSRELLKDFDQPDAETGWKFFFGKIRSSPFLRGEVPPSGARDHPFKPRLDALIAPQMFLKIMENQYGEEIHVKRAGSLFDQRRQWG